MRFNVAYGILLGFAMLELLLLQAAVFVDGYAHAITKPAVLPTMSAGGGGGLLGKRNLDNRICDVYSKRKSAQDLTVRAKMLTQWKSGLLHWSILHR